MPAFVRTLTDEQELEVIEHYRNPDQSLAELKETYGLSDSALYTVLKRHHEPTRQQYHKLRNGAVAVPPAVDTQRTVVTLDKTDTVQRVDRVPDPEAGPLWEVRFVGMIRVHGHSVDQALAEARKLQTVRAIRYVARIGED